MGKISSFSSSSSSSSLFYIFVRKASFLRFCFFFLMRLLNLFVFCSMRRKKGRLRRTEKNEGV